MSVRDMLYRAQIASDAARAASAATRKAYLDGTLSALLEKRASEAKKRTQPQTDESNGSDRGSEGAGA